MRPSIAFYSAACTPFIFFGAARAQPHAGDIILTLAGDTITTNRQAGSTTVPSRAFTTTLGVSSPDYTESPGFDCVPGTMPVPSSIGFRILAALRQWTGSDFADIAPERMQLEFGPLTILTPIADSVVEGFTLQVGSNGQWHRHLGYTLLAPATSGTYLLELQLYSTAAAIQPSTPFWLIFDQNNSGQDLRRALAYVRFTLAGECPADLDNGSGQGLPDLGVDINDLLYFLVAFEAGDLAADLDDGSGQALPDDGVDINDLLFFLARFEGGC